MPPIAFAFLLTLGAGLATSIGGLIAVAPKLRDNPLLMPVGLGLSAGVMIYVSFVELLPQGQAYLAKSLGPTAPWVATGAFFLGMMLAGAIDRLVPGVVNPHEFSTAGHQERKRADALIRTGTMTALAIGVHNFPEGFATLMAALESPGVAVPVAIAIALHNIPEGVAIALPLYAATRNRGLALRWASASGLAEPLGALIGFLLLRPFLNDQVMGGTLALVGGIMVFISLDELLPTAEQYGKHHASMYGLLAGMALMAVSLLVLS